MNNRGMALIFCFLVTLVLSVLFSSFFLKSISENNMTERYINSLHAFWAAEAGVAKVKSDLAIGTLNQSIGDYSYQTVTAYRTTINTRNYYDVTSTGTVDDMTRTIAAVVRSGTVDSTKFQYGIAAANELCFGGASCNKDPNDFLDPTVCEGHACWKENDTTINFTDLFPGYSQSTVESIAAHYDEDDFPGTVSGITWVDVTPGEELQVTGDLTGTGLLFIDGDVHFGGTYQFHGIIYVLGNLVARGTFDAYGSIVVASTSDVDNSINGSPTFHYDQTDIQSALSLLASLDTGVVSWREAE